MIQTGVLIESSNHESKGKCHIKSHRLHAVDCVIQKKQRAFFL